MLNKQNSWMPRKFKGKIPEYRLYSLQVIKSNCWYPLWNYKLFYLHFQEYTLKTTYYIIQTNKGTPDVNRFVTTLTVLPRILSVMSEAYELLNQLPSPIIKNISSLSMFLFN